MRIRLHGEQLVQLCDKIYERDGGACVSCGKYIEHGVKPHHEPPKGVGGNDIESNLVMLCNECHYERHNGKNALIVKNKCKQYLEWYYG